LKLHQLKAISKYLQKYNRIKKARRVQNNLIEIDFGDDESLFFDLTRGNSTIFKAPSKQLPQNMNAPFDKLLENLISQSKIVEISLLNSDKILQIKVKPRSQYKERVITLQLEFTGKYTNAILLNDKVVIEALRHIDSSKSFRVVQPNVKLVELPKFNKNEEDNQNSLEIDVESFLKRNYEKFNSKLLKNIKSQKLSTIKKKLKNIIKSLERLPEPEELKKEGEIYQNYANIILANHHKIREYDKFFKGYDFEGKEITIPLPEKIHKNRFGEYYFKKAKRAISKAKNIYLEKENLEGKLRFYKNIIHSIEQSNDPYEIEILLPKQSRAKRKKERLQYGELYWIDGYKIFVGRNSKENQKLLSIAKANDIWMHIRDIPSSHLIIRTDKQNLSENLLYLSAKLCVDLSVKDSGNYEVDYTKRKFVKIKSGSNVEYDKYKTIQISKK